MRITCMRRNFNLLNLAFLACALFIPTVTARGQVPQWIWHAQTNNSQPVFFRKTFRTPPLLWNARLALSADDQASVFLNGVEIARTEKWNEPIRAEVSVRLNQGENVIAVQARNVSGPAGLLVQLNLLGQTNVVSDSTWLVSNNEEPGWSTLFFNAAHWSSAITLGPYGMDPWKNILARPAATPASSLKVIPGFAVDLLHSAEPDEGSWICLTTDPRGRLIISPEGDRPLLRITLDGGKVDRIEKSSLPLRYAMGMLFAHDSFFANAKGPHGPGLYRWRDKNKNDQFDPDELDVLKTFKGESEHGYHSLALGPDQKLYILNGNGTKLPDGLNPRSPHRNYAEDILSVNPDERIQGDATSAPAGYILRTDADGKDWELFMGGLRNSYDFDFNSDGELFTFDSDNEWDWGVPWYMPTRILHCVSGAEYGWRDGTRLWPDSYPDSLPPTVKIGIGSPTGVRFGTRSRFPAEYQQALFAMDWSYGRILAVHLQPNGASYIGRPETFLQGRPLNLTSMTFGHDGAMYFVTGGRATQSGLYRVHYTGNAPTTPVPSRPTSPSARQVLEQFHGVSHSNALAQIWPHLASPDRFVRHAARIALESQPLPAWKDRALRESAPTPALTALLALARTSGTAAQPELLDALAQFDFQRLTDEQKLILLRILQITWARHGQTDPQRSHQWAALLNPFYPAQSWTLNRELARILIFLQSPGAVENSVRLLLDTRLQEEQIHYISQLRNVRTGWSPALRRRFFDWWNQPSQARQHPADLLQWFADVGRRYVDGVWLNRYLRDFRRDAIATLTPAERDELADLLRAPATSAQMIPAASRPWVKEWTMADFEPEMDRASARPQLERGRKLFAEAQCLSCHRFGNDGGSSGPELNALGSKYNRRDILQSILEPSKVVAEAYQNKTVTLRNGEILTGRITRETPGSIDLELNSASNARESISRKDIQEIQPSLLSPMPEGLLNSFTRQEILDLIDYLQPGEP